MFEINTALFFFGVDYHSVLVQDQDYKDLMPKELPDLEH